MNKIFLFIVLYILLWIYSIVNKMVSIHTTKTNVIPLKHIIPQRKICFACISLKSLVSIYEVGPLLQISYHQRKKINFRYFIYLLSMPYFLLAQTVISPSPSFSSSSPPFRTVWRQTGRFPKHKSSALLHIKL